LLEEFNQGQTGFLTQEEFGIIADLILKNYEIKSEYEVSDLFSFSSMVYTQITPRSSDKFNLERDELAFFSTKFHSVAVSTTLASFCKPN
jgi:hypothetical protein